MNRPLLLDLFCGAGGAARGYHDAGFDVVGVDLVPQPHYPYRFVQGDALSYLAEHGNEYEVIHASPPCQAYTKARAINARRGLVYPDLIAPTRALLRASGKPYIIENVPGAPLQNPITLCGTMFPELRVIRHRKFESNVPLKPKPGHRSHAGLMATGEWATVAGHGSGPTGCGLRLTPTPIKIRWRDAMQIDWMTRDELAQAIPPAYTAWLGTQILWRVACATLAA